MLMKNANSGLFILEIEKNYVSSDRINEKNLII